MPNEPVQSADVVMLRVPGADGVETEVSVPRAALLAAVKDTHLPKDVIGRELNKRVDAIIKNGGYRKPDELLDDEDFVAQVLEKHKPTPDPVAQGDALKQAIERSRKDWDVKELTPAKERIKQLESKEQANVARDLERQIVQAAAAAGIKSALLKAAKKGSSPAIVAMMADAFGYDEDSGEFYVLDETGDSFAFSSNPPKGGAPYMTIDEFIGAWAGEKDNAEFVSRTGQPGPGLAGGRGDGAAPRSGNAGTVTLTAEEASNSRAWQAALAKVGGDASKIIVQKPKQQWA